MTGLPVRCARVRHVYEIDGDQLVALDALDLTIAAGTTNAIMGPSGSGKSTLVNLLAGLHRPTSGQVYVGADDLAALPETRLLQIRAEHIGIAVQNPSRNLLPFCDAVDNIRFAQRGARSFRRRRALPDPRRLLQDLDLERLTGIRVDRLSGGERQRLALAVGMAANPGVLIADEPTSQLDTVNRDRVVELLRHITQRYGTTVITVTHDPAFGAALERCIRLHEGRVVEDAAA